ncbi:VOC family protein [Nocardia sp. NPDC050697]|uniref:VOC family protein n=1 Tax=Nocardia sp. NPDC050697 TaxID=3155158 RepID=UPI0033E033FB
MTVTGPDFLALQVRDVDAAAEFFERHLGLTRAPAGPPGAVVFSTAPIPFAVRAPLPGTDLDAGRAGLGVALWFGTDDADALHERLAGAGIPIAGPPRDSPFGRTFTFTGPEGYLLTAHDG